MTAPGPGLPPKSSRRQVRPPMQQIRRLSHCQRTLKLRLLRRGDLRPHRRHERRHRGNPSLTRGIESRRCPPLLPMRATTTTTSGTRISFRSGRSWRSNQAVISVLAGLTDYTGLQMAQDADRFCHDTVLGGHAIQLASAVEVCGGPIGCPLGRSSCLRREKTIGTFSRYCEEYAMVDGWMRGGRRLVHGGNAFELFPLMASIP